MLPLDGTDFPDTGEHLVAALARGLAQLAQLPELPGSTRQFVQVDGSFPRLRQLQIDLTGAVVHSDLSLTELGWTSRTDRGASRRVDPGGSGITAAQFKIIACPLHYREARVNAELVAQDVELGYGRSASGQALLILRAAREGRARCSIARADLERLLLSHAHEVAAPQGIHIDMVQVAFRSLDDQTLEWAVYAEASQPVVFVPLQGAINLSGRLTVDEQLQAQVSDLSCQGEGVIGTFIAPLVESQLQPLEHQSIPLASLSWNNIQVRDLRLRVVDDGLELAATFGS